MIAPHLTISLRHTLVVYILILSLALIISLIGLDMVLSLNCANLKKLVFQGEVHVNIQWLPPACMDKKVFFIMLVLYVLLAPYEMQTQ